MSIQPKKRMVLRGEEAMNSILKIAEGAGVLPDAEGPVPAVNAEVPNEADDDPHRLARRFLSPELRPEAIPPTSLTIRFWKGEWYRWDGTVYRPFPAKEVKARLTASIRAEFVALNLLAQRGRVARKERGEGQGKGKEKLPEVEPVTVGLVNNALQALTSMTVLPGEVEAPAWLNGDGPFPANEVLAARNGLVHLPSLVANVPGFFRPPDINFFSLNVLDYDFSPEAPEPKHWLAFLRQLWGDDGDAVAMLQEWFGYCLLPDTSQQKILLILGPKRSGKGTIARVLRALIGPKNVAGPTLSSFATNFGMWPLLGKTLAIISDARLSGGRSSTDVIAERLLTISGEDAVTVDRKNLEPVTGKLSCRIMMLTNELPRLGDSSGALPSRFLLLHTPRSWYGREDHGLTDRLLKELPGILLWAVEGWQRLRERGYFVQAASGEELLEDVRDLSSPVGEFVKECCVLGPTCQVAVDVLFARWQRWCEERGQRFSGPVQLFGRDLLAAVEGIQTIRRREGGDRHREYLGIALRAD